MMQTVQLAIADGGYAAALRDALARSCAWHVESVDRPDPALKGVLVLDEFAFARQPLPLINPERVVLISRQDPQVLAQVWEAGIVSIVSQEDPISTVLLAIMAAALRVAKTGSVTIPSGISPNDSSEAAPIAPQPQSSGSKRFKTQ
jgi:DNA-binding NarL/FixJ family response regulator